MEKKKYKVLKPIGFDGRKEAGEIVEMTDEQAKAFPSDLLEPVTEEGKVEPNSKPRKRKEKKEKKESENEDQESDEADESEESDS
jgi:hypothetical protein